MPKETTVIEDPLNFIKSSGLENQNITETEEEKNKRIEEENKRKAIEDDIEKKKKAKEGKGAPDLSVSELRKKKDILEKEKEELEKQLKELETLKELAPLKPISEYLKTKLGKTDEETVNKFIEKNKKRKSDLAEMDKKIKEKDGRIKEYEIERSDEWIEEHATPIKLADESLIATLTNFDKDGKPRHPELIFQLKQQLTKVKGEKLEPLSAAEIKGILQNFTAKYAEITKEEYEVPNLTSVSDEVRSLNGKMIKAIVAKNNWNKSLDERNKTRAFEQSKKQDALVKREIDSRQYLFRKAVDNFDSKPLEAVFEKEEIESLVNDKADESHTFFTKLLKGEEKAISYDDLTQRMIKVGLYDSLVEKVKELKAELDKEKKKTRSALPSSSADPTKRKDERIEEEPDDGKDPASFLRN